MLRCPLLALLSALGLLNSLGAHFWTLVVFTPLLVWMELWTACVHLEALLCIFQACFLFTMIYLYLCGESIKTKYFRPRALEKNYMNILILQFTVLS